MASRSVSEVMRVRALNWRLIVLGPSCTGKASCGLELGLQAFAAKLFGALLDDEHLILDVEFLVDQGLEAGQVWDGGQSHGFHAGLVQFEQNACFSNEAQTRLQLGRVEAWLRHYASRRKGKVLIPLSRASRYRPAMILRG